MSFELSADEHSLLSALEQYGVKFIVVGLSSAVLQGAHVVTQDIDLWIKDLGSVSFLNALKSVGCFYIAPGLVGTNPPLLGPQQFRIFDLVTHMHGLGNFDKEYESSVLIEFQGLKLKVLPLDRIILSKQTANREKDRAVIPALQTVLIARRATLNK